VDAETTTTADQGIKCLFRCFAKAEKQKSPFDHAQGMDKGAFLIGSKKSDQIREFLRGRKIAKSPLHRLYLQPVQWDNLNSLYVGEYELAKRKGLEPSTSGVTGRRSSLSRFSPKYGLIHKFKPVSEVKNAT